jgi:hypothetical protein
MKTYVLVSMFIIAGIVLSGCGHHHPSAPTVLMSVGAGTLEGQLVADAGIQVAKLAAPLLQDTEDEKATATVYPLSSVTIQLFHNAQHIYTTATDAYGRFQFSNLTSDDYEVRVVSHANTIARHQIHLNTDQTLTVYGWGMSGSWHWEHAWGSHWDGMPQGAHWGSGFCGAAPGPGYWHDGHAWHAPGTDPHHGPHH